MQSAYTQRWWDFGDASYAHMPPPVIMPHNGLWPSMVASQPPRMCCAPILPAGPVSTPPSASTISQITPTAKTSTARRKLTDDERRLMCIEAEQNPTMKQTQIGAKFNVERSTVSKILRQREKYMNPQSEEETSSPSKRSKAKHPPDFEKTLANWVHKQRDEGKSVSDEALRRQAQVLSHGRSDEAVVGDPDWLESFKRRTGLTTSADDTGSTALEDGSSWSTTTPLDGSGSSSTAPVTPSMSVTHEHSKKPRSIVEDFGEGTINREDKPAVDEAFDPGFADDASLGSWPAPNSHHVFSAQSVTAIDPRHMAIRHQNVLCVNQGSEHDSATLLLSRPRFSDVSPIIAPVSPAEHEIIRALHLIKDLLWQNRDEADSEDFQAIGQLHCKCRFILSRLKVPGGFSPSDVMHKPQKRIFANIST